MPMVGKAEYLQHKVTNGRAGPGLTIGDNGFVALPAQISTVIIKPSRTYQQRISQLSPDR